MTNPEQIDIVIKLNSVDVTAYCDLNQAQPEIYSALDAELDTLVLTLQDADALNPQEWQEITVADGGVLIFGGYVLDVDKHKGSSPAGNDYTLGCSDYGILLEKIFVRQEFENKTDQEIISAIFNGAPELSGFDGSTYVEEIATLPRVRFNRLSVREVMDWLSELFGAHWYMDYDKQLHYFKNEEYSAPFDVGEDPADASRKTVENPKVMKSGAGVVNLVEVVGGNYLSEDRTEVFGASGSTNSIRLLNRMSAPSTGTAIVVRRNDGGPTTNLVTNPSFEVNITDGWEQQGNGTFSQQTLSGYSGSKVLKITAGTVPTLVQAVHNPFVYVARGESITASCLVKCGTIGKAGVRIRKDSYPPLDVYDFNRKANSIERVSVTYTNNGPSAIYVNIQLTNEGNDSTLEAFFDAAQFEKKSWPTAYCDGSLGDGYAWTGTAHNSTSTREDIPVWNLLTVKTGNIDTAQSLDEVLHYYTEGRLEQLRNWPGLASAAEVDGRYEIPMRTRVRNQASHDYYGKWLEGIISAPEIVDKTVGKLVGRAELLQNSYANPAIIYTALDPGLRAGQTQGVTFPSMSVDDSFLIQRVTTKIRAGGFVTAEVELGAVDQNLVGLLQALKRAGVPVIEWDENEVLDELLDTSEDLLLVEGTPAVSGHSGNYEWDDGSLYDYAKWA